MTGNRIALDTNVAVALLNGGPSVSQWILSWAEVFLPATVVGELPFGATKSGKPIPNLARIDRLLQGCTFLPIRKATCEKYADVRFALARAGTPIPENDIWIAATCLNSALPLASRDKHLMTVDSLQVLSPP